jgi:transcriptional regulator with XRE-family HTH domain
LFMAGRSGTLVGSMPRPATEPDPDSYLGRVAMRLKALREAAGLEPDEAATKISRAGYKVGMSTVYRWEQGRTQPHIEALPAIAKAYGVTARVVLPPS